MVKKKLYLLACAPKSSIFSTLYLIHNIIYVFYWAVKCTWSLWSCCKNYGHNNNTAIVSQLCCPMNLASNSKITVILVLFVQKYFVFYFPCPYAGCCETISNLFTAFQPRQEIRLHPKVFMAVNPFISEEKWNIGQFLLFLFATKLKLSNTLEMLMRTVFFEGSEGSPLNCCAPRSFVWIILIWQIPAMKSQHLSSNWNGFF